MDESSTEDYSAVLDKLSAAVTTPTRASAQRPVNAAAIFADDVSG